MVQHSKSRDAHTSVRNANCKKANCTHLLQNSFRRGSVSSAQAFFISEGLPWPLAGRHGFCLACWFWSPQLSAVSLKQNLRKLRVLNLQQIGNLFCRPSLRFAVYGWSSLRHVSQFASKLTMCRPIAIDVRLQFIRVWIMGPPSSSTPPMAHHTYATLFCDNHAQGLSCWNKSVHSKPLTISAPRAFWHRCLIALKFSFYPILITCLLSVRLSFALIESG